MSITGHPDPEGQTPWAMQLVVYIDKDSPPTRTQVLTATARSVVFFLQMSEHRPEWHAATTRWRAGRVRKQVRRATRSAAWAKAEGLPGVTTSNGRALVRVLVPGPMDLIPRELAQLQLEGPELGDPDAVALGSESGVVISVAPDPFLPLGKAAAAAGHAAQLTLDTMPESDRASWWSGGSPVTVEQPAYQNWPDTISSSRVQVVDAGFTIVGPGTITAVSRWM